MNNTTPTESIAPQPSTQAKLAQSGIQFDAVAKSFGSAAVLSGLSMSIPANSIAAIVGRSGVGKSTLLRLMLGLLTPDSGTLVVNGDAPSAQRRNRQFALVPQRDALMPWRTAVENVMLSLSITQPSLTQTDVRARASHALRRVGLHNLDSRYPNQLSGGQRQRVSLARALVLNAPVLLLDEPFVSVDEVTRAALHHSVIEYWKEQQQTIVVVTHSLEEAVLLADRIFVIAGSPGHITGDIPVPIPRPRTDAIYEGECSEIVRSVREHLFADAGLVQCGGTSDRQGDPWRDEDWNESWNENRMGSDEVMG